MRTSSVLASLLSSITLTLLLPADATGQALTVDVSQLSVATGGTQTFTLDAGPGHASELYFLVGSTSGTAPGQVVGGHLLPLNHDPYFLHTVLRPNAAPLGSSLGLLSPASPGPGGTATATFTLPPGMGAAVVGLTVHHAFVTIAWPSGKVLMASNAVAVDLVVTPPGGMVQVPAGTFVMGDSAGSGSTDERPLHTVTLDSFYMDVFETTNEQYRDYLNAALAQGSITVSGGVVFQASGGVAYCDTTSSSSYARILWDGSLFSVTAGKLDHPLCEVSWNGALAFANWRSVQEGLVPCYDLATWSCDFSANGYRLATEAEWEYAARGGQHSPYHRYPWGDWLDGSKANYDLSGDPFEKGNAPYTTPVGYYDGAQSPSGVDMVNGYGLHDMAGNVWEWCWDWYGPYDAAPSTNPQGPAGGFGWRVIRGGGWIDDHFTYNLRCANRYSADPGDRYGHLGLRLVRSAP